MRESFSLACLRTNLKEGILSSHLLVKFCFCLFLFCLIAFSCLSRTYPTINFCCYQKNKSVSTCSHPCLTYKYLQLDILPQAALSNTINIWTVCIDQIPILLCDPTVCVFVSTVIVEQVLTPGPRLVLQLFLSFPEFISPLTSASCHFSFLGNWLYSDTGLEINLYKERWMREGISFSK